ncbi:MAG TPA: copper resistance CopC family protein [Pseudolysinimonas sp.]|nr:copper resistance CopC family protein [Pseudolysinimonas sp.]
MRRGPALVLAFAFAVGAVVAVGGPAMAHNQIVSSTPRPNETLTALPARFEIETNEALLDIGGTGRGFAFEIEDAAGKYYETGCVSIVDNSMFTEARLGAAGAYTVIYQLVSSDGHTVSGRIPFTWAPSGTAAVTRGVAAPPGCHGAAGPAAPSSGNGGSESVRDATVPLADILWVGGIIVAVALAVVITLVLVTRRRTGDEDDKDDDAPPAPPRSP